MNKKSFYIAFSALAATFLFSFNEDEEALKKKYAETITAADLKARLSIIASDEYEGRETGKKGQHMTAEYLAKEFRSFGIPGIPGIPGRESTMENPAQDYYQIVPLIQLRPGGGSITSGEKKFSFGTDYYYTSQADDQKLELDKFVFAGYGIQDSLYRDYDNLDVSGKAVIILNDEPHDKKGKNIITGTKESSSWATNRRRKPSEARTRKATVLIVIIPDFKARYEQNKHFIESPSLQLDVEKKTHSAPDMPVIYISKEMADFLMAPAKRNTDKLTASISKKKKPVHFEFGQKLTIEIERKTEKLNSENVLGYLEGGDLKNELVVVTAHMDHLGTDGTVVYNGADDDGSGTVSVLELAQAFAQAKKEGHGPRRSILFMLVTGEEKGLLGSKWYTGHPVFPLANTVCDLNIDMVGRVDPAHLKDTNYVYVIGTDRLSTVLKAINEKNNARYTGMTLDYKYDVPNEPNNFYMRSDHYNFAKNNIPIAFFFNGTHADYHKETDEVSKINFALMERRAKLVYYDCWEIANRDERLPVDVKQK